MEGNIFEHFRELWMIVAGVTAVAVAWGEMRWRVYRLQKDHSELKGTLACKADVEICRIVHSEQKESLQMVLSTIELGFSGIRKDIRHLTDRLDTHIANNGKQK